MMDVELARAVSAAMLRILDPLAREATLLAAALFIVGGLDDLLLDLLYLKQRPRDRRLGELPACPAGRLVIFVAAWQEEGVIGAMLARASASITYPNYRIYVGCYPNDPATIAAVDAAAADEPRIRRVVGDTPGPTTKADCLNTLWRRLLRDEAHEGRVVAVILHDAEDVIDADELTVHAAELRDHALVQVPVLPLIDPAARWIGGHYADEFADAHGRQLVVRGAVGAALPLAGVGCAIRRDALDVVAAANGGAPFDADSLTEDYELGLRCGARGLSTCFARVRGHDGRLIGTRAYFPATIRAAVRQKARWMLGIAFAGWDRTGWGGRWRPAEYWMRMRDRRGPLAVFALVTGYLALVAWGLSFALHWAAGTGARNVAPILSVLLVANAALLAWRLLLRGWLTARLYGWREGLRAVPRVIVANIIAMIAARRAFSGYLGTLAGRRVAWDKTTHRFPDTNGADTAALP